MTLPPTASMAQNDRRGRAGGLRAACVAAALLMAGIAVAGPASGAIVPCPGALPPGPVVIPPRVGLLGAAPADSRDAALFPAPIGPGQTLTLRIVLDVSFIVPPGSPPASVDYKLYHVRGTQPGTAIVMCDDVPLLAGTVTPDRVGVSQKTVERIHVLSAPNHGDDPYPVLVFLVETHGNALVNWKITPEPCGYPCIEPILFPGPCDPLDPFNTCREEP